MGAIPPHRHPFDGHAELLRHPAGGNVLLEDHRDDPVQSERPERGVAPGGGRFGRDPLAPVGAADDPAELYLRLSFHVDGNQPAVADQGSRFPQDDGAAPEPVGLVARQVALDPPPGAVQVQRTAPEPKGLGVAEHRGELVQVIEGEGTQLEPAGHQAGNTHAASMARRRPTSLGVMPRGSQAAMGADRCDGDDARRAAPNGGAAPDRAARSLVTGRSHVIGIVLATGAGHPDLQHPFFQEVLVGLKTALGVQGYDLLLFSTVRPGNDFGSHRYLSRARHHRVDGLVLMGVDRDDPEIQELVGSEISCIAVDLDLQGGRTGNVMSDNVEGAAMAVRHLHEIGHRRIALIGGPTTTRPGVDRLLGYRREVQRLGLPYRPEYVREGDFYPESGYAAMSALLDLAEPPTAVFAAADLMAAGAIQAIAERGLSVPRDVADVGFDDIQIAPLLQPSLTTIRQDKQGLGSAAGDAIARLIEDPELEPPVITVPVELVVRESTRRATGRHPVTVGDTKSAG